MASHKKSRYDVAISPRRHLLRGQAYIFSNLRNIPINGSFDPFLILPRSRPTDTLDPLALSRLTAMLLFGFLFLMDLPQISPHSCEIAS